jgi:uncharacterized protein
MSSILRDIGACSFKLGLCGALLVNASAHGAEGSPPFVMESAREARFDFSGPVGERVKANVDNWLLQAPQANPGMLDMFRMRDRQPVPQLVPWAGEFVGKYLISAIEALRLSDDPRLRQQVAGVIAAFIATQAEDGYLGPFPKSERLLKHWDLWGHYHAMFALVMWHEQTGDAAALEAARKAADLVCAIYLDTGRRVFDAGDHEMNMTILTAMAMMYRLTGEPRYLRMAREVEKDWERAGDYLRAGLDGREYFRSPRPRWESLHDLQGLVELWRITGDVRYRQAFEHHWRSIRRWDWRNTGAFSSGEQATGNPYAPTAIETCCTVAWIALTVDYLRLTGDPGAADDLELATLNGGLGAQHPSGRWWTYNTPMDGVREASAHSIVFQARAGTPELNCCSVNGPRVLGMLSDWAVMSATNGLVLNWLGAGRFSGKLADGSSATITSSRDAWLDGHTELQVTSTASRPFTLLLRIPGWAQKPIVRLNTAIMPDVVAGKYAVLTHVWKEADRIEVQFNLPARFVAGANEAAGKVSLYRGPLLLAYDQAQNSMDEAALPALDLSRLSETLVVPPTGTPGDLEAPLRPWLRLDLPTTDASSLRLIDFASAGVKGTRYRSWLAVKAPLPAPALTQIPPDGVRVPVGPVQFRWRGSHAAAVSYRVEFASHDSFPTPVAWATNLTGTRVVLNSDQFAAGAGGEGRRIYWRVVSRDANGETIPDMPAAWFVVDPAAPPQPSPPEQRLGPNGEIVSHSLRGEARPEYGELKSGSFISRGPDGTEVNGKDQMMIYAVSPWPEEDFTVSLRVQVREGSLKRFGQVFSAWAAGMDDPLRIVIDNGKLAARMEAGGAFSTPAITIEADRWYAVAAAKRGGTLTLWVDGNPVGSYEVPAHVSTGAQDCALGGNPHFSGNEFLAARFADFHFYAKALGPEEIKALTSQP